MRLEVLQESPLLSFERFVLGLQLREVLLRSGELLVLRVALVVRLAEVLSESFEDARGGGVLRPFRIRERLDLLEVLFLDGSLGFLAESHSDHRPY